MEAMNLLSKAEKGLGLELGMETGFSLRLKFIATHLPTRMDV